MSPRDVVVLVLLVAGGALVALGVLGIVLLPDALDRLHYAAPASYGVALLCAAVVARGGWSLIGWRAILLGGLVLVSAPVLTAATARAVHLRERGP